MILRHHHLGGCNHDTNHIIQIVVVFVETAIVKLHTRVAILGCRALVLQHHIEICPEILAIPLRQCQATPARPETPDAQTNHGPHQGLSRQLLQQRRHTRAQLQRQKTKHARTEASNTILTLLALLILEVQEILLQAILGVPAVLMVLVLLVVLVLVVLVLLLVCHANE